MRIRLEIDGLPELPNKLQRRHWRYIASHAKRWHKAVADALLIARSEGVELPAAPFRSARLILTRHSTQEPDRDNLAASWKPVIDGLTRAGLIWDDKPSVIGTPECRWVKAKRGEGRVTVEVIAAPLVSDHG